MEEEERRWDVEEERKNKEMEERKNRGRKRSSEGNASPRTTSERPALSNVIKKEINIITKKEIKVKQNIYTVYINIFTT